MNRGTIVMISTNDSVLRRKAYLFLAKYKPNKHKRRKNNYKKKEERRKKQLVNMTDKEKKVFFFLKQ